MSPVLRLSASAEGHTVSGDVANGGLSFGLPAGSENTSRELNSQLNVAFISWDDERSRSLLMRAAECSILFSYSGQLRYFYNIWLIVSTLLRLVKFLKAY